MNDLWLVGLNHKSAPVAVREACAAGAAADVHAAVASLAPSSVLLSTCNRFEVYGTGADGGAPVLTWIAERTGLAQQQLREHVYVRRGRNACKHLFFVASSLDSLVVGETQIRRQVKDAYAAAQAQDGVGAPLHRLFRAALRVSKEIAEKTGVGRGNVSVAGAAADLAERVLGKLERVRLLVLGAGETADLCCHHLRARGVTELVVLNRTVARAQELAARHQGVAGGLDELATRLQAADVVVSASAGNDGFLLTAATLRGALRRRRGAPVVLIDIAVPRTIDPGVDELDNAYRYDMDTLEEVTRDALRHRRSEFLQCCTLVDAATLRLETENRAGRAGGAIAALDRTYREVAAAEVRALRRRLPDLDPEQRRQVERAIHRVVRKLLHPPVRALRQSEADESEVIRRVFGAPLEEDLS